jgi:hypothetical protein
MSTDGAAWDVQSSEAPTVRAEDGVSSQACTLSMSISQVPHPLVFAIVQSQDLSACSPVQASEVPWLQNPTLGTQCTVINARGGSNTYRRVPPDMYTQSTLPSHCEPVRTVGSHLACQPVWRNAADGSLRLCNQSQSTKIGQAPLDK